jgi:hypothetical protein
MDDYPMVRLLLRWGNTMANAAALAVPLFALALVVAQGWSWLTLVGGLLLGGGVFVMARSYVEVIRIIADTLLPK